MYTVNRAHADQCPGTWHELAFAGQLPQLPRRKSKSYESDNKKTPPISHPSSNYHPLDIFNVLVIFHCSYCTWHCYPHCTGVLSEVQRDWVMCPRPPTYWLVKSALKPIYFEGQYLVVCLFIWFHQVSVAACRVFFFFNNFMYLFILAVLSLCCGSQAFSSYRNWGLLFLVMVWLSLWWLLLLHRLRGVRASVVVVRGLSCSTAGGIFPDQGLNPCPLYRQADSYSLYPQKSPRHVES